MRAVDPAGNVDATPEVHTWTVDTGAPTTSITAHPASLVRVPTASIAFTSADPSATFECQLDGGSWTACASPRALTGLADGPHTFKVRATDTAGNVEATPATTTWTVDTTAPSAPGLSEAPAAAASSSTFVIDRAPGTTLECQLDDGPWVACDSPWTPSPITDGTHTAKFRQTDPAGNVSALATHTWTLDRSAPDAPTVLNGPTSPTYDRTATFEFAAEPGATIECRVDGGAWGSCASPLKLTGLGLGDHVLELRATDAAGNVSPLRTERWTVNEKPAPAPAATPAPTPTPAPDAPKAAKVEIPRDATVDPKASTVGCTLTGVNITACKVAIYAKASELGLAEEGTPEGDKLIRIGTGYQQTDGSTAASA